MRCGRPVNDPRQVQGRAFGSAKIRAGGTRASDTRNGSRCRCGLLTSPGFRDLKCAPAGRNKTTALTSFHHDSNDRDRLGR